MLLLSQSQSNKPKNIQTNFLKIQKSRLDDFVGNTLYTLTVRFLWHIDCPIMSYSDGRVADFLFFSMPMSLPHRWSRDRPTPSAVYSGGVKNLLSHLSLASGEWGGISGHTMCSRQPYLCCPIMSAVWHFLSRLEECFVLFSEGYSPDSFKFQQF